MQHTRALCLSDTICVADTEVKCQMTSQYPPNPNRTLPVMVINLDEPAAVCQFCVGMQ